MGSRGVLRAGAATAGVAVLVGALGAMVGCKGDEPPPVVRRPAEVIPPDRTLIRVAGSGGMTPLARALGMAFRAEYPAAPRVTVEDSVGSGGGIRAALDGAVDIGLITRRLNAQESGEPLLVVPLGRDAVVFAAHPDVTVDGLSSEELLALYSGRARTFPDGNPVTVLLRDRGESANLAIDAGIPGMLAARETAARLGCRVLYHDDAMAAALAVTPGAIGVYALGLMRETRIPLKVLKFDGRTPSAATLADGSWPLSRPVALVVRSDRVGHVRAFLDYVLTPEARRIIADSGCLPETRNESAASAMVPAAQYGPPAGAGR